MTNQLTPVQPICTCGQAGPVGNAHEPGCPRRETLSSILAEYTPTHAPKGRAEGDGLRKPLERLLAAFKGMMPFPLVVQAVAEGLVRDAETALRAAPPTRDGAEGARTSPIGQSDVDLLSHLADSMGFGRTHDMLRRVIAATPYLSAPPKPAPDAMREALKLIERTCHVRAATIARDALRSAPVPPADDIVPDGFCSPGGTASCLHLHERERCSNCPVNEKIDNDARDQFEATRLSPSPAVAAEPDCGWPAKVEMLEAALEETLRQRQHWRRLAKGYPVAPMEENEDVASPPVRGDRSILADQYADYSEACDKVRREMRALVLERNDPKLSNLYYRSLMLSEHEAARRTLLSLPVQPNLPLGKDALYAILSRHIPSDMIDGIWQEVAEAGLVSNLPLAKALDLIWKNFLEFYQSRFHGKDLVLSDADRVAFIGIAEPILQRLAAVQSSAGEREANAPEMQAER